jgi:hypothetical protein
MKLDIRLAASPGINTAQLTSAGPAMEMLNAPHNQIATIAKYSPITARMMWTRFF